MSIKRGILVLALILTALFCIISASAVDFKVSTNESYIEKNYGSGEFIRGNLKMSFNNQTDASFTSTFAGGASILEALEGSGYSEGHGYTCAPENCQSTFALSGSGDTSKTISVGANKVYGLKLTGKAIQIKGFKFNIEGGAESSCTNQINIDLLDDKIIDFTNDKYVEVSCAGKNYGCFRNANVDEAEIGTSQYCERMNLSSAPAYRVGAKVRKGTSPGDLTMELYNAEVGDKIGECTLPVQTSEVEEIGCTVEYSSMNSLDAFVCISAASGTDYRINTETTTPCGLIGPDPTGEYVIDYEVFGQSLKYDKVNSTLNDSSFAKQNPGNILADMLQAYVDDTYEGDCPTSGCIIPIRISGLAGDAKISLIKLTYDATGATGKTANTLYDIIESKPKINSGNVTLDIEKMKFVVPETAGTKSFELKLEGTTLISGTINVSVGFSFDIGPRIAFLGIENEFTVYTAENITKADWDFGDGSTADNAGRFVIHTYNKSGNYNIAVELTNSKGEKSKKTFAVSVGNAKDSADILILRYIPRLANITAQLNLFEPWKKSELVRMINLTNINKSLNDIKSAYDAATTDADYENVVRRLILLNVPSYVLTSLSGNTPASFYYSKINVKYIEEISKNSTGEPERLKNAIMSWMEGNYNVNLGFETITKYGDFGKKDLATVIKVDVSPKKSVAENSYLIIGYPLSSTKFKEDYGAKALSTGAYIPLAATASGTKSFEFIVPENVQVSDLGIYISPGVSAFSSILTPPPSPEPKGFPTGFFIWMIIIILVVTFVVYIILQEWYKKKYETYLFKNRDDLYNLINFIANGRKSGLGEKELGEKLKKSGWKGEQIEYSTKKLDGKRTGLYEIPVMAVFERIKIKKELEKRRV